MSLHAQNTRLPDRIVAYTDDAVLADSIARLADGNGIATTEILPGGPTAAITEGAQGADILLLDIDDTDEGVEALGVLSAKQNCRLLAIGRRDDVRTYRKLHEAGAADYLVLPLKDDVLLDALRIPVRRHAQTQTETANKDPRVVVFLGCRGGVGATTLAVSSAWWTAEKLGVQAALVDLDLVFGTATLALDLLPGRGLREALEHPERIDPLFVGSAMINATDNLFVLGAEEHPGLESLPVPDGPVKLVEAVAESVPAVYVDLPRGMLPSARDLLRRADEIVLVTDLSLGGLRDSIRLKTLCRETAPETALTLIGCIPQGGQPPIQRAEFERAYEGALDWVLPWEPKAAAEAAADGKPIVSRLKPRHQFVKAVEDLAARTVANTETQPEKAKRKWLW